MNFLLDTNILVYSLQRQAGDVFHDFLLSLSKRGLCFVSAISRFEVLAGSAEIFRAKNTQFLDGFPLLDVTRKIADRAGILFQEYRRRSLTVDNEDLFLAATALEGGLSFATTNAKHFPALHTIETHYLTFTTRKKTRETKTVFILTP